jgi:hypothetical protein
MLVVSMFHRIAKVLHASLSNAPSLEADIAWEDMAEDEKSQYWIAAQRILQIMRTPSDAMLRAGNLGTARDAANVWERMMFCALHDEDA